MIQNFQNEKLPVTIIGLGGGGCNVVNFIYKNGEVNAEYLVCDYDQQALNRSEIPDKVLIAESNKDAFVDRLFKLLDDETKITIFIAGLGGTSAPILSRFVLQSKRVYFLLIMPFPFEGHTRNEKAARCFWMLNQRRFPNNVVKFENEKAMQTNPNMELKVAFELIDTQISSSVKEIVTNTSQILMEEQDRKMRLGQATHLEKIFVEQALKGNCGSVDMFNNPDIFERQRILNEQFEFNEKNIERIAYVNQMIDKQTKRAYLEALEIEEYLLEKMKLENAFIADYEIDFRVSLFSSKKYNHFEQMNGSSFFEFRPYLFNFLKKDGDKDDHYGWTFDTNHNELGCNGYEDKEFHPLQHQFHCALMHDLYDHTYLAWQDIVDIEDVWIDVEVKMQNNIVM